MSFCAYDHTMEQASGIMPQQVSVTIHIKMATVLSYNEIDMLARRQWKAQVYPFGNGRCTG